ncbi:MAG: class I SAM-dependent methyltransferase [Acidobacteriota bacterium]|nr:class I SAM-dependent methyltransferase [Acidobacteriota bacterium]
MPSLGGGATAPPASTERIPRHSTGLGEFTRMLAGQEEMRILDLGPTSPTNIARLTGQGHKAYNEDVLLASNSPVYAARTDEGKPTINVDRFLVENLTYTTTLFDAVLCWDVPDYLPEAVVRPAVERLHRVTKAGGVLLAFFHTRDAGPDAPYYRYHIVGDDQLELQQGPRFRLQRIFNNRNIEKLFQDFASIKFFLARDNVREVLVVK